MPDAAAAPKPTAAEPETGMRPLVRAHQRLFLGVGALSFAINLLMLTPALYMLQVYDRVLSSRNTTTLALLTLLVLGLFALEALLDGIRARALARGACALDLQLGPRLFDACFARSLSGHPAPATQALGDLQQLRQFLTSRGLFAFFDAPWTPVYILVTFLLHPWLGMFTAASALMLLALAWANEASTARRLGQATREGQQAAQMAASQLRNAEVIAAHGMLDALRHRWLRLQAGSLVLQAQAADWAGTLGALTRFARVSLQSGVLALGALLVIRGELTPGAMIAGSILLGRALAPVDQAMAAWRGFVGARGAFGRLDQLLRAFAARPRQLSLPAPTGELRVESLVAGPPGGTQPVLKGVRFGTPAGTVVAVLGPSAAGKSTLARVLVGAWSPMAGAVRLDGADLRQWNRAELGPHIGYLPQDIELFDGTVAENIARFGDPDDARVVRAAQRAGVHELVLQLPQGYATPIGEGGTVLSGGQRQRIALARALYGDPVLVVLDEPNANLDEAGDQALAQAIAHLRQGRCTVFVVTHRKNLLALADHVLVLNQGQVQGYGPRDEVLAQFRPAPADRPAPRPTPLEAA